MNYNLQKNHYENLWKKVGNWENESPNFKTRIPEKEAIKFIEFLKQNKITKGNVLDLGCGGGRHTTLFAKKGYNSYGIDFSKKAINLAKLDAIDKKVNVEFEVGDVFKLPYPKDCFDIVYDGGCLHHIRKKDWKIYLKNILRVLKKQGYFIIFEFSVNTKYLTGKKISKKKNWIIKNNHYSHFFTKKEIKDLFSKHFDILKLFEIKREDKDRYFYISYMKKK